MKMTLTVLILAWLTGQAYAQQSREGLQYLTNTLEQMDNGIEQAELAWRLDQETLILQPQLAEQFREARDEAGEINRKAQDLAMPERLAKSVGGGLLSILGLSAGGAGLVGLPWIVSRMRNKNRQGIPPRSNLAQVFVNPEHSTQAGFAAIPNTALPRGGNSASGRHPATVSGEYPQ